MRRQLVTIVSMSHSGSTLLSLVMGTHPRCFCLGEFRHIDKWIKERDNLCRICPSECDFWKKFRVLVSRGMNIFEAAFESSGADILIDSSKKRRSFEKGKASLNGKADCRVLHIIRNPYGSLMFQKVKYRQRITKERVKRWVRRRKKLDNYCDSLGDNCFTIKYEDFCLNPDEVAGRICAFLGIDYFPGMTSFWEKHHHLCSGNGKPIVTIQRFHGLPQARTRDEIKDFVDSTGFQIRLDERYKTILNSREKRIITRVSKELLEKYGYETLV